ncbi:ComEA family DNA-binding protein [Shewanella sp. OMA3-2]|uniref:ComEA family DNA-binding protein n=1 Tax=Shewanella sp. OMA3-2 TaxID=2908650 RepID=UPI001F2ED51D|nr:helix-hairpin-helix domain-containing protein [Shewanella sp. OMA3-2]UJF23297.1 helix-hairpin-helix domain-containing protein [Shewanella sp. OMA3-2]
MKISPFWLATIMAIGLVAVANNAAYAAQEKPTTPTVKAAAESSASMTAKVNLNKADAAQLQTLNGIGEAKAKAIIEYRNKNGKFTDIKQLTQVSGIGEKLLTQNADRLAI